MKSEISKNNGRKTGRFAVTLLIVLLLIAFVTTISVTLGAIHVSPDEILKIIVNKASGSDLFPVTWEQKTENIIWNIRFPRVIMAFIVGAGLSLCGVLMQALTKNPLADPYVLGISSGASLGAVLAMLLGVSLPVLGRLSVSAGAFAGALVSILLVYLLARTRNAVTPIRLILVGVAVSAMFQAFTNYIVYTAPDDAAVREATFWMLGGLGSAEWADVPLLAGLVPPALLLMLALAKPLNAMMMGDSSAVTLGVNLTVVRNVLIGVTALLTASSVAVSGCIGFVGWSSPTWFARWWGRITGSWFPWPLCSGPSFSSG